MGHAIVEARAAEGGLAAEKFLRLVVGGRDCAVGVEAVHEILDVVRTTPLPLTPPFVRGVMNLRGAVIPVIDLAVRCGGPPTVIGRRSSVVVVDGGAGGDAQPFVVGVLVDAVSEVLDIAAEALQPAPALGSALPPQFLRGMAHRGESILPVLDLQRALDRAELAEQIAAHLEGDAAR